MRDFEIFLYDQPIDVISRWFGGSELATRAYHDPGTKPTYMRERDVGQPIEKLSTIGFGPAGIRLTSYENSPAVTVVQSTYGLINTFGVDDLISGPAQAHYMKFRYGSGSPTVADFSVYRSGKLLRSAVAHNGESRSTRNAWTAIEFDQPLAWEGDAPYVNKRLNRKHLITLLGNLGLDFDSYSQQRFARVVEFGQFDLGQDLAQFREEAAIIAPTLAYMMGEEFFEDLEEYEEEYDAFQSKLRTRHIDESPR